MTGPLAIGDWLFHVHEHATTVSPDRGRVFTFDLEGRPLSWFEHDRVYKRSLSSEVFGRERTGGRRHHWRVPDDEAARRFGEIGAIVASAPAAARRDELGARLAAIATWTPECLAAERERFAAAYERVSILPPDQYLAVVLQATFGCSWNRCTFCSFYQGRSFRTRGADELADHARRVRALLGRAAGLRRRIFLADGNALVLANRRLLPLVAIARAAFPDRPLYGFVDVFTGERKTEAEWTELRRAGLERVYVGLETGDDALLGWLDKPGDARAAEEFVVTLKRAGLLVSVIVMAGVGGSRFAAQHVRRTLELAGRLPLGGGDIVYVSPFRLEPGSEYARRVDREGLRPLAPLEIDAQYVELRDGIRRALPRARVTRYDIREFVY